MRTVTEQIATVAFALLDELEIQDELEYNAVLQEQVPLMIVELNSYVLDRTWLSAADERHLRTTMGHVPFAQARVQALLDDVYQYHPEKYEALLTEGTKELLGQWRADFGLPAYPQYDQSA